MATKIFQIVELQNLRPLEEFSTRRHSSVILEDAFDEGKRWLEQKRQEDFTYALPHRMMQVGQTGRESGTERQSRPYFCAPSSPDSN
jgi:hypothetical protein